jgi:hypothetical protein
LPPSPIIGGGGADGDEDGSARKSSNGKRTKKIKRRNSSDDARTADDADVKAASGGDGSTPARHSDATTSTTLAPHASTMRTRAATDLPSSTASRSSGDNGTKWTVRVCACVCCVRVRVSR